MVKCKWFYIDLDGDEPVDALMCEEEATAYSCNFGAACEKHKCRCSDAHMKKVTKDLYKHNFYLDIAEKYAEKSKDPKYKVGCVIVTPEGILYPGYNGDEIGGDNVRDSMETGQSGFVHAEANAILKFNPTIHKCSIMYLTFNPCVVCARMIVNTQAIMAVYYRKEYPADLRGVEILNKRGILCQRI